MRRIGWGAINHGVRWSLLLLSLAIVPRPTQAQETTAVVPDLGLDSLLNTPVSTAAKYSQSVRQVAGSVTIVTAEDIRRFGYRTVADVLQGMAGVYTSNPRSYESIGVRGFGRPTDYNNRILLLMDGHSVFESMWGQAMLGEEQALNLESVERIELIRGPSSALYGTGAMFAVVNVITRAGDDIGGVVVDGEVGSLGRQGVSLVAGSAMGSAGSILVSALLEEAGGQRNLYFPEFDAPATNNGVAENLDGYRRGSARLSAAVGSFALRTSYNYRSRQDPTGSYGTDFNAEAGVRDYNWFAELSHSAEISPAHLLSTRAYYDDLRYQGNYPYDGLTNHERAVNRVAGVETSLRWDLAARNRLTIGSEYRRNLETRYYVPADTTFDYGRPFSVVSLYVQDEHQLLPNLTLLGGLRHDNHEISGGATTPRAAVLFDPRPGTTLKVMYGHAFRAPTIYETEFKEVSLSSALKPERLSMLEFIWLERLNSRLMISGSVFHYRVEDLIDVVDDSTSTQLAYVNRDVAKASGIELTLDARPTRATRGYLNYTFQRAVGSGGQLLTNSPRHMLKGGLALDLTAQLGTALELRYESSRLTVFDTRTDGFVVANGNLNLRPFARKASGGDLLGGLELGIRVENILGTRYAYPGGTEHIQPSIEQNGRMFTARLTTRF